MKFKVYVEYMFNGELYKEIAETSSWFLLTQQGEIWEYGPLQVPKPVNMDSYEKVIPLFYIGEKDKEGTEIYGDDIVENETKGRGVVIFERGTYMIEFADGRAFNKMLFTCRMDLINWRVIGNKHLNPELLKQ